MGSEMCIRDRIASKAKASIVPVGIAGTEDAMPSGARFPKRTTVGIVAGEPMILPEGRIPRAKLGELTNEFRQRLQAANDRAHEIR